MKLAENNSHPKNLPKRRDPFKIASKITTPFVYKEKAFPIFASAFKGSRFKVQSSKFKIQSSRFKVQNFGILNIEY